MVLSTQRFPQASSEPTVAFPLLFFTLSSPFSLYFFQASSSRWVIFKVFHLFWCVSQLGILSLILLLQELCGFCLINMEFSILLWLFCNRWSNPCMDMLIGFNRGITFFFAEFTWCFLFRNFFGAPPFLYVCVYNFYVISLRVYAGGLWHCVICLGF